MGQGGQVRGHQAAVISASSVECTQISRHLAFGNPVEGRFGSIAVAELRGQRRQDLLRYRTPLTRLKLAHEPAARGHWRWCSSRGGWSMPALRRGLAAVIALANASRRSPFAWSPRGRPRSAEALEGVEGRSCRQ
jgi:hypothetical protein